MGGQSSWRRACAPSPSSSSDGGGGRSSRGSVDLLLSPPPPSRQKGGGRGHKSSREERRKNKKEIGGRKTLNLKLWFPEKMSHSFSLQLFKCESFVFYFLSYDTRCARSKQREVESVRGISVLGSPLLLRRRRRRRGAHCRPHSLFGRRRNGEGVGRVGLGGSAQKHMHPNTHALSRTHTCG